MKRKRIKIITQKNKDIFINIFTIKSLEINIDYIKINSKVYDRKDFNWGNWQYLKRILNLLRNCLIMVYLSVHPRCPHRGIEEN